MNEAEREKARQYYHRNRERILTRRRARESANSDVMRERVRQYRLNRVLPDSKKCSVCGEVKPISEYFTSQGSTKCKPCFTAYARQWRVKHPEKSREIARLAARRARLANPEAVRARERRGREGRRDQINAAHREWRRKNKAEWRRKRKAREAKNKERMREWARQYQRRRLATNPQYKMAHALRTRLGKVLRLARAEKMASAVRDMGCTLAELQSHIESLWLPGMSWDNYGVHGWHIDHKTPLASVDLNDREQVLKVIHYTNLQPMWAEDNLSKGCKIA